MPPITKIDRDVLADKFTGCLIGLAIGDAMGLPAEGMSPYQVLCKFHFIDGFFPVNSKDIGLYSQETRVAVAIARTILEKHGEIDGEAIRLTIDENEKSDVCYTCGSGTRKFSRVVPIAMAAAATGMDDQALINACKLTWNQKETEPSKTEMLAQFIFARTIRECIRNAETMASPYELFESDRSFLHKTIHICSKAEAKMENTVATGRLCDRLAFTQKRLMDRTYDQERFHGAMGTSGGVQEALAMALYSFLRAPDEFMTVMETVSLGGPSSLLGAMVGALVGAYIGASAKAFPADMKDFVQNGTKLEALATALADCYMEKPHDAVS